MERSVLSLVSLRYRWSLVLLFVIACGVAFPSAALHAQSEADISLQGSVISSVDRPQPGAIVYLKNRRKEQVKGAVSGSDGGYRFDGLAPGTDYQLWAEYKGKRSPTLTIKFVTTKEPPRYVLKLDRTIADFLIPFGG